MSSVVAFVPNLMDRSKFPPGVDFIKSAAEIPQYAPQLIVVDLDRCPDACSFLLPGADVIGFGPHVESNKAEEALQAGYSKVLSRSVFFRQVAELLKT